MTRHRPEDEAVDVLAAEEFPVGGADAHPEVVDEPPHDVLAADEFTVPAADPALHEHQARAHGREQVPASTAAGPAASLLRRLRGRRSSG